MARAVSNLFIFWLRFVKVRLTPANYVYASNISRNNGQKNKLRPVQCYEFLCYEFLCLHKTRSCNLAGGENSAHNFLHCHFPHS